MPQPACKACGVSVRLSEAEVQRIIAEYFYFGEQKVELASDDETARRLALCGACPDLRYGTTCAQWGRGLHDPLRSSIALRDKTRLLEEEVITSRWTAFESGWAGKL